MRKYIWLALAFALPLTPLAAEDGGQTGVVPVPDAVIADGIPPIPVSIARDVQQYREIRRANFVGWDPKDPSMIVATRFGETSQLHRVRMPAGARTQLTFEPEPVSFAIFTENGGEIFLTLKDIGGNEFYQIFRIIDGQLELLTDGSSRNTGLVTSPNGKLVGYTSTLRNGRDSDLWVMDPRDPASARMVLERDGVGWTFTDFAPDSRSALVRKYFSINHSELYSLDLQTGTLSLLSDPENPAALAGIQYDPLGRIWLTSDEGSDFKRLGTFDPVARVFTPIVDEGWDIDSFDIAPDGSFIAYEINAGGVSQLKIFNMRSGETSKVALPPGTINGLEIAPWGTIGFTFNSNRSPGDAYSVDPATLAVRRWTFSETGGLETSKNVLPELVEVESFDGEKVSGFLYRPEPGKFPDPRPLVVDVHGGPEAQATASYIGSDNYLVNELGIAKFYPNVRGSDGFGKRFLKLDNGPFLRENSVKDIGAFIDTLASDPAIDANRMAVEGGSYGGYVCYASAILYGDSFRAANCVVAISDFVTFLENTQDYRRDLRRAEYGDERDPVQRAKLKEISPLTRADEIRIPLMVATGANDPRVPASEADQIIKAVRANGGEAWHFLALNEGHGFAKKENADFYIYTKLLFFQRHLLSEEG